MKEQFVKKCLALGILAALTQFSIAQNTGPTTTNAAVVTVVASDPSASEIGPDPGTFTVFRTGTTSNSLTVFVHIGGTASNGVDYQTLPSTITIPAGEPGARVTVTPIPDTLVEGNESVILTIVPSPLASIPEYQIGTPSSALVTIADGTVRTNLQPVVNIYATDPDAMEIPDVPPGIEIAQQIDPAVFTVTRSGDTGLALVVYYHIGGTASNGVDYQTLPGTVTIPEGAVSALIEVDPIDDFLVEGTETVVLEIVPPVCAAIFPPPPGCYLVGRDNRAVAYIHDNDVNTNPPPVVTIVASDPDAAEAGPDTGTFTVSRTGSTSNSLVVYYSTAGTAQNGIDYLALSGHLEIPAGSASADITVTPIDDKLAEGPETVIVQLRAPLLTASNTTAGTISTLPPPYFVGVPSSAIVTIADDDFSGTNVPPMVNISTPADGATFTAPANILIVANARDVDDAVSTVEFFAGDHSLGVRTNLPVANPLGPFIVYWTNVPVGTYALTALATDVRGASTRSAPVHVSVIETNRITNLPPIVTIEAIDAIAAEGTNFWFWPVCTATGDWQTNVSPTSITGSNMLPRVNTATFKVRRTGETNADLTVYYAIGGTASNGVDYETLSGQVTIPAGQHAARITVVPIDDTIIEPIETVLLRLQPPPSATATAPPYVIGIPGRAAAIIVDNDSPRPPCMTLPDGLFHLCRPGTNGFCFRLEASTNLVNWTPICTNSVTDGAIHYIDPDASDSVIRFYRTSPADCPPAD